MAGRNSSAPLCLDMSSEQAPDCLGLLMTASGSSSLRFFPWRRHGCKGTARTLTSQGNLKHEKEQ